ncbi:MAG: protein kinase [Pirellulales bacterium]|nr:protein kinase [Pirellulales bacterium]
MNELTIFSAAIELPAAERPAYLRRVCGENSALQTRIEKLLELHEQNAAFMEQPAVKLQATVDLPGIDKPGMSIGPYQLLEQIGEGGMGSVWMAQQHHPVRRLVAIKLIKAGMDSKLVLARFEAERQALALMEHPNIARVLDAGTAPDGRPYFVLELVRGIPITQYCDERRLNPRERLELFIPVCQAIQHAHQKGIIHRDIKPSNVLIALYDDQPVPKVIDFGVAKAIGQPLTDRTLQTGFGTVVGTPQYMSPEQATFNNLDIDTRSDIYSLGVLLYEILTGSPPFTQEDIQKAGLIEMLRIVREQDPPRPSTKVSTSATLSSLAATRRTEPRALAGILRNELDWIVMKALEKDRSRRYESATGFAADIGKYLAGEPVLAHPPTTLYRIRKFLAKHKGAVLAASLLLLALILGLAGTGWGLLEAELARGNLQTAYNQVTTEQSKTKDALQKATSEEQKAKTADLANRRSLARQYVANGAKLLEQANFQEALTWFAAAREADAPDPRREEEHRIRLGTTAAMCPRPRQAWLAQPGQIVQAGFDPSHTKIFTVTRGKGELIVDCWQRANGAPQFAPIRLADPRSTADPFLESETRLGFNSQGTFFWTMRPLGGEGSFQEVQIWTTATGRAISPPLRHILNHAEDLPFFTAEGTAVALIQPLPDSNLARNGGEYTKASPSAGEILVWEISAATQKYQPLRLSSGVGFAFLTTDQKLLVGSTLIRDGATWRAWRVNDGQPVSPEQPGGIQLFSPDRRFALVNMMQGKSDASSNTLQIWDFSTNQPLGPPHHSENTNRDRFGFSTGNRQSALLGKAGRRLIAATLHPLAQEGLVSISPPRLYDTTTLHPVETNSLITPGDSQLFRIGEFDPLGERIFAYQSNDFSLILDGETGAPVGSPIPIREGVRNYQFSPRGERLIILDGHNQAHVADTARGQALARELSLPTDMELRASLGAGGTLALLSGGNYARVWNAANGQPLTPVLTHPAAVLSAHLSQDGSEVLTIALDGVVRIWPLATFLTPAARLVHPPGSLVNDVVPLSADGQTLLTTTIFHQLPSVGNRPVSQAPARLTHWSGNQATVLAESWHTQPHMQLIVSNDFSKFAFLQSQDGVTVNCQIHESRSGTMLGQPFAVPREARISFSPEGKWLLVHSDNYLAERNQLSTILQLRESETGDWVWTTPEVVSGGPSLQTCFIDAGRYLVAVNEQTALAWDVSSGAPANIFIAGARPDTSSEPLKVQLADGNWLHLLLAEQQYLKLPQALRGRPVHDPAMNTLWTLEEEQGRKFARSRDPRTGDPLGPAWELPNQGSLIWNRTRERHFTLTNSLHILENSTGRPTGNVIHHGAEIVNWQLSDTASRALTLVHERPAGNLLVWRAFLGQTKHQIMNAAATLWHTATAAPLTPPWPLLHHEYSRSGYLTADGKSVLFTASLEEIHRYPLQPLAHTPAELVQLVQGLSGMRISPAGQVIPLPREEYLSAWEKLATLPSFQPVVELDVPRWQRARGNAAYFAEDWLGADFHFSQIPLHERGYDWERVRHLQSKEKAAGLQPAEDLAAATVAAEPHNLAAWLEYGKLALYAGRYAVAGDRFEKAARIEGTDLNPWMVENAWRYYLFSRALAGDLPKYQAACRQLLELTDGNQSRPGAPALFLVLRWTTLLPGGIDQEQLQNHLRDLDIHPAETQLLESYHSLRAQCSLYAGDDVGALAYLQSLATQHPEQVTADEHLVRVIAHAKRGELDPAQRELERANEWAARHVYADQEDPRTGNPIDYTDKLLYLVFKPQAEAALAELRSGPTAIARHQQRIQRLRETLADPELIFYHAALADELEELGRLFLNTGRPAEAQPQFTQAVEIRRQMAAARPNEPDYVIGHGWAYNHCGDRTREGGQPMESLAWYQQAIDNLRPAIALFPSRTDAKNGVRHAYVGQGLAYNALEQYKQAAAAFAQAGKHATRHTDEWVQAASYYAISKVRAGQVAAALETTHNTLMPENTALALYNSACVLALASSAAGQEKNAAELKSQALTALTAAVRAGYANPTEMSQDADLAALRGMPEFYEILRGQGLATSPEKLREQWGIKTSQPGGSGEQPTGREPQKSVDSAESKVNGN